MSVLEIRREKLFEKMAENSVMAIYAGEAKIASADELYPFVVNKNFFYLTGIEQENSVLLLIKSVGERKTYLFVDEYNEIKEKWTGKKITFEYAREVSGIQNVYSTNSFDNMFNLAIAESNNMYGNISKLYLDLTPELKIRQSLSTIEFSKELQVNHPNLVIENLFSLVESLRVVKDDVEIANLYEAINITNLGLNDLIVHIKPGMKEHELSDRFEMYGRSHDRHHLAFSTICAGGKNATVLHYPINLQNDRLNENDLVLFDLGFSHNGYSADVSRTYPVSGKFSPLQRKVYEAVLNCNKAVIEYAHEGLTILELQEFAIDFLKNECIRLELMDKDDDIKKYYYHGVSHFLGLDTHDCGDRKKPLEAGNVITVEPGLYFANYGIGVRIEDDIEITNGRAIVLTSAIKKEISDIEKLFQSRG